jgi:hypothetical protein
MLQWICILNVICTYDWFVVAQLLSFMQYPVWLQAFYLFVRFKVLTVVNIKITVCWDIPHSLEEPDAYHTTWCICNDKNFILLIYSYAKNSEFPDKIIVWFSVQWDKADDWYCSALLDYF